MNRARSSSPSLATASRRRLGQRTPLAHRDDSTVRAGAAVVSRTGSKVGVPARRLVSTELRRPASVPTDLEPPLHRSARESGHTGTAAAPGLNATAPARRPTPALRPPRASRSPGRMLHVGAKSKQASDPVLAAVLLTIGSTELCCAQPSLVQRRRTGTQIAGCCFGRPQIVNRRLSCRPGRTPLLRRSRSRTPGALSSAAPARVRRPWEVSAWSWCLSCSDGSSDVCRHALDCVQLLRPTPRAICSSDGRNVARSQSLPICSEWTWA
jgi:hypothetical protein